MSIFSGGLGGFGGRFDDKLASKVDKIVGNQTKEQKLAAQLREMGIDPDSLPLKPEDAKRHIYEFMTRFGDFTDEHVSAESLEFVGSSLGFTRVVVHGEGYDYNEYDDEAGEYKKIAEAVSVTSKSDLPEGTTWRDLERSWDALKVEHGFRFRAWGQYSDKGIESITTKFHKEPKRLRAGQVARLERSEGAEHVYARMGGLFGDDVLTNLTTMQPITESGWIVVEVIEE